MDNEIDLLDTWTDPDDPDETGEYEPRITTDWPPRSSASPVLPLAENPAGFPQEPAQKTKDLFEKNPVA